MRRSKGNKKEEGNENGELEGGERKYDRNQLIRALNESNSNMADNKERNDEWNYGRNSKNSE